MRPSSISRSRHFDTPISSTYSSPHSSSSSLGLRSSMSTPASLTYATRTHLPYVPTSMLVAHCIASSSSTAPSSSSKSLSASSSRVHLPYSSSSLSSTPYSSSSSSYVRSSRALPPTPSKLSSSSSSYRSSYTPTTTSSSSYTASRFRTRARSPLSSYYRPIKLRDRPLLTSLSSQLHAATATSGTNSLTRHSSGSESPRLLSSRKYAGAAAVVPTPSATNTEEATAAVSDESWQHDLARNISRNKYLIKFREIDRLRDQQPASVVVAAELPAVQEPDSNLRPPPASPSQQIPDQVKGDAGNDDAMRLLQADNEIEPVTTTAAAEPSQPPLKSTEPQLQQYHHIVKKQLSSETAPILSEPRMRNFDAGEQRETSIVDNKEEFPPNKQPKEEGGQEAARKKRIVKKTGAKKDASKTVAVTSASDEFAPLEIKSKTAEGVKKDTAGADGDIKTETVLKSSTQTIASLTATATATAEADKSVDNDDVKPNKTNLLETPNHKSAPITSTLKQVDETIRISTADIQPQVTLKAASQQQTTPPPTTSTTAEQLASKLTPLKFAKIPEPKTAQITSNIQLGADPLSKIVLPPKQAAPVASVNKTETELKAKTPSPAPKNAPLPIQLAAQTKSELTHPTQTQTPAPQTISASVLPTKAIPNAPIQTKPTKISEPLKKPTLAPTSTPLPPEPTSLHHSLPEVHKQIKQPEPSPTELDSKCVLGQKDQHEDGDESLKVKKKKNLKPKVKTQNAKKAKIKEGDNNEASAEATTTTIKTKIKKRTAGLKQQASKDIEAAAVADEVSKENVVPAKYKLSRIGKTSASSFQVEGDLKAAQSAASSAATMTATAEAASKRIRFREYTFDDFNFLSVLGHGGWGFVFLAELKEHDACFAVKAIKKQTIAEDDDYESIMIERKMLALGNINPFICKLFCTFETAGYLFFAMEFCAGGDLMFHVQREGKFNEPRCRFYAAEIICAIRFLHNRGIVYRDLKLDNILLCAAGHIRLVDFGMCLCRTYREEMLPSNFCGTPEYIAPEIIKGVPYNHSVDWWSFGVLLYEMAIGKMPFRGGDENELLWNVCYEQIHYPMFLTKELTSLLKLLLEREPIARMGMATCKAGDIYEQLWFRGVDWRAVEELRVEPPFVPQVDSARDVQNFDADFTEAPAELSPVDESVLSTIDQKQFAGFVYTNPEMFVDK